MRPALTPILEKVAQMKQLAREVENELEDLHMDEPKAETPVNAEELRPLHDSHWAAEFLGVSLYRLYQLVRTGDVPAIRLGNAQLRFSDEALRAWIESRAARARANVEPIKRKARHG